MTKRTHYLIDKKYQLRTAFSIIGFVLLITAVIVGVIIAGVVRNNSVLHANNEKIDNLNKIENSIFMLLSSQTGPVQNPALQKAFEESMVKHEKNMETLEHIITVNQSIVKYNKIFLILIIVIVVFETLILYIMLIRKTHHVSGPIQVMSSYMKDIMDGKEPHPRPLRNNDELKEFYDLFSRMVSTIIEREKKH